MGASRSARIKQTEKVMKKIKISASFWNSLTESEGIFLMGNAFNVGVQSCKTVINLARKHKTSEITEINKVDIFSIGGVFTVKMKGNPDVLMIRLSSGMMGDTHKVYLNKNLIFAK